MRDAGVDTGQPERVLWQWTKEGMTGAGEAAVKREADPGHVAMDEGRDDGCGRQAAAIPDTLDPVAMDEGRDDGCGFAAGTTPRSRAPVAMDEGRDDGCGCSADQPLPDVAVWQWTKEGMTGAGARRKPIATRTPRIRGLTAVEVSGQRT